MSECALTSNDSSRISAAPPISITLRICANSVSLISIDALSLAEMEGRRRGGERARVGGSSRFKSKGDKTARNLCASITITHAANAATHLRVHARPLYPPSRKFVSPRASFAKNLGRGPAFLVFIAIIGIERGESKRRGQRTRYTSSTPFRRGSGLELVSTNARNRGNELVRGLDLIPGRT